MSTHQWLALTGAVIAAWFIVGVAVGFLLGQSVRNQGGAW